MSTSKNNVVYATLIVAICDKTRGIGKDNGLVWKCKGDMKHFSKLTKSKNENVLLCGRKTFESFGSKNLPGRHTIVMTRDTELPQPSVDGSGFYTVYCNDFNMIDRTFIESTMGLKSPHLFVIGGGKIYDEIMTVDRGGIRLESAHVSRIVGVDHFEYDTFFDPIKLERTLVECNTVRSSDNVDHDYSIQTWYMKLKK